MLGPDIHGKSAKAMIKGLLAGESPEQVLKYASNRLKASDEELLDALAGDLSPSHHFVLTELMAHIDELEARIETFRQALLQGLAPYQAILRSLQTIPGLDETGAALLLVEIGDDMSAFGTPERLASWAGVCPGNNESAGKKKTGKTRKGNAYVRRILCEGAKLTSGSSNAYLNAKPDMFKGLLDLTKVKARRSLTLAHKLLKNILFIRSNRAIITRMPLLIMKSSLSQRNALTLDLKHSKKIHWLYCRIYGFYNPKPIFLRLIEARGLFCLRRTTLFSS